MKARVAERGQITIPKSMRKKLGIVKGTVLDFTIEHDKLVAIKCVSHINPVREVFGCLKKKINVDAYIDDIRGTK